MCLCQSCACSSFVESKLLLPLLFEMIVRSHAAIDPANATQLILHLRALGVANDHDLILLLQERESATIGSEVPSTRSEGVVFQEGILAVTSKDDMQRFS